MIQGRCVLVAEDDPIIRRLLKFSLDKGGFSVVEAVDGEQALELAGRCHPDALVTDLKMPNRDGRALVLALRCQPIFVSLPVLVLTASPDDADADELRTMPRVAVMAKPPRWSAVVSALNEALAAGGG